MINHKVASLIVRKKLAMILLLVILILEQDLVSARAHALFYNCDVESVLERFQNDLVISTGIPYSEQDEQDASQVTVFARTLVGLASGTSNPDQTNHTTEYTPRMLTTLYASFLGVQWSDPLERLDLERIRKLILICPLVQKTEIEVLYSWIELIKRILFLGVEENYLVRQTTERVPGLTSQGSPYSDTKRHLCWINSSI
jgi:hypothetical protein